ncbi:MAG TPA: PAS domain S-box protein [Rhodocyclaceae bacterium]|nr:PAS domain S-box protein [Rhodocyclaceae bacterium]
MQTFQLTAFQPLGPAMDTLFRLEPHSALVVATELDAARTTLRFLEERGMEIALVPDMANALRQVAQNRPSLILIDGSLPGEEGYALCRRLKAEASTSSIPIIFLLASTDMAGRANAFRAGANDYLIPPVPQEELEVRIAAHVRRPSQMKLLRIALDTAMDAAFLMNEQGGFAYVNEAACQSLGYSREELLQLTIEDIDPDVKVEHIQANSEATRQGTPFKQVLASRHRRRDGSIFPVEISVSGFNINGISLGLCTVRNVTARKEAEEQLHASEQAFRAMVEHSPDLISRYDVNCRRTYMNPAFVRHCYRPMEELLGKTPLEAPVMLDPKDFMARLKQVMSTGQEMAEEFPIRDSAGKLHWGHVRLVPEFDQDNKAVSVLSIGRNITAIKENENRFRTLAENFPDLLIRFDNEARHTYVNPAVIETFGLQMEGFYGKRPDELTVFGDKGQILTKAIHKAYVTGQPSEQEIELQTLLGTQTYEIRCIPKRDSGNCLIGILVIGRNVTQLRETERALRTSEREFRSLAENSPSIIVRYDTDCRRTYVNPAFLRKTGRDIEAVLSKSPEESGTIDTSEYGFADAMKQYTSKLREVMATQSPREFQLSWPNPENGEMTHHVSYVVPEYDLHGTVIGVLAIGHDITALKLAETRLEESYKLLQELTSRRETAREEERKYMAREVHDELGQRLTALRLKMGLLKLKKQPSSEDVQQATGVLIEMTDQTLKVVRDVTAFLRPAALGLGIGPALDWLADEFQRDTGIACALDLMVIKPILNETQATALFRSAQESLTNVARHSGAKEARISLEEMDGNYVLEIVDSGLGFDMNAPQLQRFGLAGIRERMLSVGGTTTVESAPGKGTRVRVTLPVPDQMIENE